MIEKTIEIQREGIVITQRDSHVSWDFKNSFFKSKNYINSSARTHIIKQKVRLII